MLEEHDVHFTLGESIGTAACRIPSGGVRWQPMRQPVPAALWEPEPADPAAPFSTVGRWDATGRDVVFAGRGLRLARSAPSGSASSISRGRPGSASAWRWTSQADPTTSPVSRMPDGRSSTRSPSPAIRSVYRAFIRRSRGEFTVAKDVNVRLRSGWFSDRSACYLAAGRPVVNQDTGFDEHLPTGDGLFAFRSPEDAAAAFATIAADYPRQCRAARALAVEHFAPARVLAALVGAAR